ncbi:MAG: 5'/3'-nucleotidase SurE [Rhodospirillaceae bacterium TMED8]|nr:5'/3'-nucleotidase SurE [Magnetovibrio sp.]OUT51914.1 MAG: 5'/3'-nucleotidase SurE [Rhodospirillaceae bacterium TMED8]|tara:strand:- start:121 stop:888 length:768 start_codon:yes stop_codon:yes gene_type:complete
MNLSRLRVLISNDDSIHSPGLKVLVSVARRLFREVWVVAPETEQSATSHSLTLRRPLRIRKVTARRFAIDGTPTDSVLLGVSEIMKNNQPDLLLSGINLGANLGDDITYSGTVAAAMEGTLLGIRSVALSQYYIDRETVNWKTSEVWTAKVLKKILKNTWPPSVLMNINFPDCAANKVRGIRAVSQGQRKIGGKIQQGIDPRGDKYFWIGAQREEEKFLSGTDLEAVTQGSVAVTPLTIDLTDVVALEKLKATLR